MKIQNYKDRYIKYESNSDGNSSTANLTYNEYGVPVYADTGELAFTAEEYAYFMASLYPEGYMKEQAIKGYEQTYGVNYPGDEEALKHGPSSIVPEIPPTQLPSQLTKEEQIEYISSVSDGQFKDELIKAYEEQYGESYPGDVVPTWKKDLPTSDASTIQTDDDGNIVFTKEQDQELIEMYPDGDPSKEQLIKAYEEKWGEPYPRGATAGGISNNNKKSFRPSKSIADPKITDEIIVSSSAKEPANNILNTNSEIGIIKDEIIEITNEVKEYWSETGKDQQSFSNSLAEDSEYLQQIIDCNKLFASSTIDYVNATESTGNKVVE